MKIQEASLSLRFYTRDGWTRSKVAELSDDIELYDILPRYFDERDKLTENSPQNKQRLEIEGEFTDCEYYACYCISKWWVPKESMDKHELERFGG